MNSHKARLLSGTVICMFAGVGLAVAEAGPKNSAQTQRGYASAENPTATARPANPTHVQLADSHSACNPCNPCAAKACNPCNPCAAKACNPCNPCAAKACNPCNPCAAKACNPCNPCAAKACNPCNPCAAKACNPCNPCAANACNPCNPCAAGGSASSKCVVPRLKTAAYCNPCNPCGAAKACNPCNPCAAAKACNPCNPCAAAKACNPCNPCAAAKACNPCNPCAANACNPCNPCGPCGAAAVDVELTAAEATVLYDCLQEDLAGYSRSGLQVASAYAAWENVATSPYQSDTHGGRYVNNFVNATGAAAYRKYEEIGKAPVGTIAAKDSFLVKPNGKSAPGPLFLMEKLAAGSNAATGDWKYTLIMPNGNVVGTTGGKGAGNVQFCHDCHVGVGEDQDYLFFLPEENRKM